MLLHHSEEPPALSPALLHPQLGPAPSLAVGDSFYWNGVKPGTNQSWVKQWAERYGVFEQGSPLYNVPFLSVMGNHDYGNTDKWATCPHRKTGAKVVGGQAYASTQFNADKNPERPGFTTNFWLPDYNYHYSLPAASLELIAVDMNMMGMESDYPWGIGGDSTGHEECFASCGGWKAVRDFLYKVGKSGEELLVERAKRSSATTVVIINHYPTQGRRLKTLFEVAQMTFRRSAPGQQVRLSKVLTTYGHTHHQACHGKNEEGECDVVMSGGGGGCCKGDIPYTRPGFSAVHLKDDGGFTTDVEGVEVSLDQSGRGASCRW